MCGPTSVGALWGRLELLEAMEPFNLGGHMIRKVAFEETTWGDVPHKFEAGTQPIAEAVGFGAAVDYVNEVGLDAIERARARARRVRARAAGELAGDQAVRAAGRAARGDRLVQRRRHPPARRGAGARHGRASRSAPATTAASR